METKMKADFIKRPPGKARSVDIRDYATGSIIPKGKIVVGSRVTLRIPSNKVGDVEDVLVNITEITKPNEFSGQIQGFESSNQFECGGHKIDDPVTFEEAHIWP